MNLKRIGFLFPVLMAFCAPVIAQEEDSTAIEETPSEESVPDKVDATFHSTRIISGHSVETLRKGVLEFRVEHRFGDIAGDEGGVQSWFGFDNSADIRLAFEYGVTDKFMVGLGRSKGTGEPYRSLVDGFAKYRVFHQDRSGMPISLAVLGTTSYSYMKASEDLSLVSSFPKTSNRLAYSLQLNIARKFADKVSVALMPTMVHRNLVTADDVNTLLAMGGALRWAITPRFGIMLEYYHCLADDDFRQTKTADGDNLYQNSLGVAFEWITFGHNFTLYLTNSRGFGETQFITNTYDQWQKGQFRFGFCIGRKFERE